MKFDIRKAQHSDAANIISAHRKSIREVCSKDYDAAQIAAWSGRNFQEGRWHLTMDSDLVWVISDQANNIYGFAHLGLKENHQAEIAGLYFVPQIIGLGLGKKIVHIMLSECEIRAIKTVSLSSTKTALGFYQEMGFQQIGPPSFITIGGLEIECFHMKRNVESRPFKNSLDSSITCKG